MHDIQQKLAAPIASTKCLTFDDLLQVLSQLLQGHFGLCHLGNRCFAVVDGIHKGR